MADELVIIPKGLDEYWCDYCLSYTAQEIRTFVNSHHYENKQLILHVKHGTQCLQCLYFNEIADLENEEPF